MKPATIHSGAEAELLEAMDWYDNKRFGLGLDLLIEVQRALQKIEENPTMGARHANTVFRFIRTKRFPYVIYYEEFADHLWVTAIAHERRRPNYWRGRKPE